MELYDMHSHILPGIDDGAKTIEDSVTLLNALRKQGVKNVCFTPHFYTNEVSVGSFLAGRDEAFERLKPHIPEGMKVTAGAEVYICKFIFNGDDFSDVCFGKSKYILTEHSYDAKFTEHTMSYFTRLIEDYRMTPIMPHFERYDTLVENPSVLRELQNMGVIIQTNVGTYSKNAPFFQKRKFIKYIKEGLVDILGSDTHSLKHNSPYNFQEALDYISDKCGYSVVEEMMDRSRMIFNSAYDNNNR